MKLKFLTLTALLICTTSLLIANNVDVTNVSLSDKNTTEDYQLINFNISWDNSWNINGGSQNHDAAVSYTHLDVYKRQDYKYDHIFQDSNN